jgi:hypothetical protein
VKSGSVLFRKDVARVNNIFFSKSRLIKRAHACFVELKKMEVAASISDESNSEMTSTKEELTKVIMEQYGFGHLLSRDEESSVRDDREQSEGNHMDFNSFSALSKTKLKDIHSKIVSKLEELRITKHSSKEEQLAMDMMKDYGFGDVIKESTPTQSDIRESTPTQSDSSEYLPKNKIEKASESISRKVTFSGEEIQYIEERE